MKRCGDGREKGERDGRERRKRETGERDGRAEGEEGESEGVPS